MNSIYTILTFEKLEKDKQGWPDFGAERLVGYYSDWGYAIDAVKSNVCDIWETCYNYAFVEEVEEGVYNPAPKDKRWLFKFNIDTDEYEEIEEPEWLDKICGFSMG